MVKTRTLAQIRDHAQNFFEKPANANLLTEVMASSASACQQRQADIGHTTATKNVDADVMQEEKPAKSKPALRRLVKFGRLHIAPYCTTSAKGAVRLDSMCLVELLEFDVAVLHRQLLDAARQQRLNLEEVVLGQNPVSTEATLSSLSSTIGDVEARKRRRKRKQPSPIFTESPCFMRHEQNDGASAPGAMPPIHIDIASETNDPDEFWQELS